MTRKLLKIAAAHWNSKA